MNYQALVVPLALLVIASSVHAAAFSLIDDTEMRTEDWTAVSTLTTGGFGFGSGRSPVGGNPNAYRTIFHTSGTGPADGYVLHMHATRWTPATQGSIGTLDMALQVNVLSSVGATDVAEFGLIVVQSGMTYVGPTYSTSAGSGWRSDLFGFALSASSFDLLGAPAGGPDFSLNGAPMSFGFYSRSTSTTTSRINVSSGTDNFRVTVLDPVPAPGSAALAGAIAFVALLRRR